eukprot:365824-Chlamydomonas_euryale.AAC.2
MSQPSHLRPPTPASACMPGQNAPSDDTNGRTSCPVSMSTSTGKEWPDASEAGKLQADARVGWHINEMGG